MKPTGDLPAITAAAVAPGGELAATGSRDGAVKIWDTLSGECRMVSHALSRAVVVLAFDDAAASLVLGDENGQVELLDVTSGRCRALRAGGYRVFRPAIARTCAGGWAMLMVSWDRRALRITDLGSQVVKSTFTDVDGFLAVAWDPTCERLLCGGFRDHVSLRELDGTVVWMQRPPQGPDVISVALHHEAGRAAWGHRDGKVTLWDLHAGRALATAQAHPGPLTSSAFDASGRHLVTAAGRDLRVWDDGAVCVGAWVSPDPLTACAVGHGWFVSGSYREHAERPATAFMVVAGDAKGRVTFVDARDLTAGRA